MTMTDPIADMLTRIRNANQVQFEKVKMPASKVKAALAEVLEREGYIAGFEVADADSGVGKTLEITMKYAADRTRTISGLKRISKPGLRIYAQADQIPRVLGGIGVAVVSTSKGLMSDREARRNHLGGEVLCYVW